jgi:hypothetical protein
LSMVERIFCDECDKQLSEDENVVSNRVILKAETGRLFQVLISGENGVWNQGHLCQKCAAKLFAQSKRRQDD